MAQPMQPQGTMPPQMPPQRMPQWKPLIL
jgi:hypothetical protein